MKPFPTILSVLLILLVGLGAMASEVAGASVSPPTHRIYLALYRGMTPAEQGFMDYLRDHDLPVEFIVRDAGNDPNAIPAMRDDIRAMRPDLVYSFGTTLTRILAGTQGSIDPAVHITDIPILFNIVADPVGAGLVPDLKSSGRNLTGTMHTVPIAAQYRTLREALPCTRLGILYNPQEPNSALSVDALTQLAERDGLSVLRAPVTPANGSHAVAAAISRVVQDLLDQKVDVIYLPSDSFVIQHARLITGITAAAEIPTFSATEDPVRASGATMGLVSAYYNVGQFAGFKATQILRDHLGPSEIPIESINRFAFLVNVDAARRVHRLPPIALLRVAELICYNEGGCLPDDVAAATVAPPGQSSGPTVPAIPLEASKVEQTEAISATSSGQTQTVERIAPPSPCDPGQPFVLRHDGSASRIELPRCVQDNGAPRVLDAPPLTNRLVLLVQQHLNDQGFDAGRNDGLIGPRTRAAIRRFQTAQGLKTTGMIDFALLDRLQASSP
ncbi:ABC transporter substrate binding protein [Thiobaca trueperi]|uniref:ABC-type uncharacterized transport system substrate-binding protein n=1 Tax=Thiobaca trueperi TaxID=127458 RepID=A0A4R3MXU7_9GAMM|nr:ABC transporter substrate binding protein [Thiobaca trueperi]TCT21458.1 ABC-type uncharacterized transport system substrate-binding protein [Thiobaca trueperi]